MSKKLKVSIMESSMWSMSSKASKVLMEVWLAVLKVLEEAVDRDDGTLRAVSRYLESSYRRKSAASGLAVWGRWPDRKVLSSSVKWSR